MSEVEWRDVPGWPGYQVSSEGQARSFKKRPRVLRGTPVHGTYVQLHLGVDGKKVHIFLHTMVLLAFSGPRPDGMETRHLDGNPANNRPDNLAWGTHTENNRDRVRHGTHHLSSMTECIHGHPFDEANTYHRRDNGGRQCRTCRRIRVRKYKAARNRPTPQTAVAHPGG